MNRESHQDPGPCSEDALRGWGICASLCEAFVLAWCAATIERWGFENNQTDVPWWAPNEVRQAWLVLAVHGGRDVETAVALWSRAQSLLTDAFCPDECKGGPS